MNRTAENTGTVAASSGQRGTDMSERLQMGVRFHQSGELQKAEELYEEILKSDPVHADAMHLLGFIRHQTGDNAAAAALIRMAIRIHADSPDYYNSLGLVLKAQGKIEEAVSCYQKALSLKPDMTEALNNLGIAFQGQGKHDKAVACYRKILETGPDIAEVHNNMGNAFKEMGKPEAATASYKTALQIRPDYAEAWFNMANTCLERNRFHDAIYYYRKGLELNPVCAEACYNMANAHYELGQLEAAINGYSRAVRLKPDFTAAYDNMGKAWQDMGRLEEALACYEKTLRLEPENADTHFDRSLLLLLSGNFKEGWKEYEWRFVKSGWKKVYPHRLAIPRWDGSDFEGKRLLVHAEQGLGDTIQFARYLPMVKKKGGEVVFEVKEALIPLFRNFPGIDGLRALSPTEQPATDFDLFIPLLSLPGLFATTPATIPAKIPYLYADPRKTQYWRTQLPGRGLKAGVIWAGSPGNNDDRNRSCNLSHFFPLARITALKLYGLQKGAAAAQADDLPKSISFANVGQALDDFSDTAAVIENLDLIISVDTAVVHLAGAMGKPVWTLLPYAPDWRWFLEGSHSPWYPTMRLFRQTRRGDWKSVFQQVARELKKEIQKRARTSPGSG